MMLQRHLIITVGDLTLFDGDVDEIVFTDSDAGVSIQGKMRRATTSGGGAALMQLLSSATKKSTQEESHG
jgi:hypothetical protein